jgi:hypothetical protein
MLENSTSTHPLELQHQKIRKGKKEKGETRPEPTKSRALLEIETDFN